MIRYTLSLVILTLCLAACGDERETCGKQAEPEPIASGEFPLVDAPQSFMQGSSSDATLSVDRDARLVTLTYVLEDGATVVETYAMTDVPGG